jgi:integrase
MRPAGKNRKFSPKYVSEHLNWLGAVYNHFGLLNVTAKVVRPRATVEEQQRRLKCFTREEMEKMFEACGEEFRNCFVFMAYTGVRNGEMHDIVRRGQDINEEEQIVWVTGKGRKRRPLALRGPAQAAWEALQGEVQQRGVGVGETIFDPYERWADKRLRALCRAVGIAERGPHALRHTFATHALLFWGWDISVVAKWLGHESIDVTYRIYGHLIPATPPRMWGWDWSQCDQGKANAVNDAG